MTLEIMCTDLCEIWIKSEGVISNNVFGIIRPPGGAVKDRCELEGPHINDKTVEMLCTKLSDFWL